MALARASCCSGVVSLISRWVGNTVSPGVLECDQVHEDVAVGTLAADLLGIGPRGFVAVVSVGDQELGVA